MRARARARDCTKYLAECRQLTTTYITTRTDASTTAAADDDDNNKHPEYEVPILLLARVANSEEIQEKKKNWVS